MVACFITLFHLWGMVLNTLPIFLKSVTEDMGWSRGDFSVAAFAGGLASLITAPIAGRIVDVRGPKPVLIAATLMLGFGLLGASRTSQLWHFYVANLAIGSGLMCGTITPCSALLSNCFASRSAEVGEAGLPRPRHSPPTPGGLHTASPSASTQIGLVKARGTKCGSTAA